VKGERDDSAWTTCVDALRSNWVGEIAPSEVVAIMCQALDEIGDRTIPRDDHARKEGEAMCGMVFADLSGEEVIGYDPVVSNVLRAMEKA
jgi:hypothetical protein